MTLLERLTKELDHRGQRMIEGEWGFMIRLSEWEQIKSALARPAEGMTPGRWLAFDVGCIECGEESSIIGTFATQQEAEQAACIAQEAQNKNWKGQHSMEVFDLLAAATSEELKEKP